MVHGGTTIDASEPMTGWSAFLDPDRLEALVPEVYARYRPAVMEGMAFFLDRLPDERMAAILADQLALPEQASEAERLVALARHSPALHKLGQVIARDHRLASELRQLLQSLETMEPALDREQVEAALLAELGPLDRLGVALDGPPLAEASVAIVAPFAWTDPASDERREGVFKLLKPGIEETLAQELALLVELGAWLDESCARYGLPYIAYEATFEQVRLLLEREVLLAEEQAHLAAARKTLADVPGVLVPELLPWCTRRVTAMERVRGRKVTEAADLPPLARQALGTTVVEALLAEPIWSRAANALFHGDPHAGNLMLTEDGRLALLDWSLAARLGKAQRAQVTRLLLGGALLDPAIVRSAVQALAAEPIAQERLDAVIDVALRQLVRGQPLGVAWLTGLLDEAALEAKARFPAELLLFRKSLYTASGVVRDVAPELSLDGVLMMSFVRRLMREWGQRWLEPFASNELASHLSTADLSRALLSLPLALQRGWLLLAKTA